MGSFITTPLPTVTLLGARLEARVLDESRDLARVEPADVANRVPNQFTSSRGYCARWAR